MTLPKLSYFDMAASRGEECRLAFVLAGVEFEDNRIKRENWPAIKESTPFGALPTLEIEGQPPLGQSNAILIYIGEKYGLLPEDHWQKAQHIALLSTAEDLRAAVHKTFGIKDEEELIKARTALVEGPVAAWCERIEKHIKGPYVNGEKASIADIKLFVAANWLQKGILNHVPADCIKKYSKLQGLIEGIKAEPQVIAWYARS